MSLLTTISKGISSKDKPKVIDRIRGWLATKQFASRREISEGTGIEISSLCAALLKATKDGTIKEAFNMTCPETGREVVYYSLPHIEEQHEQS